MKKPLIFFLLFGIINILLLGGCAKDNHVVLHSVSADHLLIKDGYLKGRGEIVKSKLALALASRVNSVSGVYNISDQMEGWVVDNWYILFSVKTTSGDVYTGFKCTAFSQKYMTDIMFSENLYLVDCGTNNEESGSRFADTEIKIPLREILAQKKSQSNFY